MNMLTNKGLSLGIDAQRSRVDEGKRVPVRVWRGPQSRERRTSWAIVHGGDITIGGATVGSGVPHQDDIQKV